MARVRPTAGRQRRTRRLPALLDRRFEAIVFDWDGTAVPDRQADAGTVRNAIEELCALGMQIAVISGTHLGNVDGQLRARPSGPGSLHLLLNRGSEVFRVGEQGPERIFATVATDAEEDALDRAAELTVERLGAQGLRAEIVSQRLNRRKIDLIPEPEWADPPKARIAELLQAIEARLAAHGIGSLAEAAELARGAAVEVGLPEARVTSDAKHVEIGLTDKADSGRWIATFLRRQGIGAGLVLIVGDEFGALGGLPGSDSLMLVPEATRSTAVSVGAEPTGVPDGVVAVPGGPEAFLSLLRDQLRRRRDRAVPESDGDPSWTIAVGGVHRQRERADATLLTQADGTIGTRGSPLGRHPAAAPSVLAAGLYGSAETRLQPGPRWNVLPFDLDTRPRLERILDLRTGILHQRLDTDAGTLRSVSLSALSRPGTVALRIEAPADLLAGAKPLEPPGRGQSKVAAKTTPAGCMWGPGRAGSSQRPPTRHPAKSTGSGASTGWLPTSSTRPSLPRKGARSPLSPRPARPASRRCCASTALPGPRVGGTPTSGSRETRLSSTRFASRCSTSRLRWPPRARPPSERAA